jgi:hypothetical protein
MLNKEVRKQSRNAVIGNFVGNAGSAYWLKYELTGVAALGLEGYIGDFLGLGFFLPAILGVIFLFWFRRRTARGEFERDVIPARFRLSWLSHGPWRAIGTLGLLGLVFAALPLGIYLLVAGMQPLTPLSFALVKGVWAAMATAIVIPVAIYHGVAIANKSQASRVPVGAGGQ